jgi:hypothetical protein
MMGKARPFCRLRRAGICRLAPLVLGAVLFLASAAHGASGPEWTDWESSRAVTGKRDWLVIDPSGESSCYIKQSYADPEKMEITLTRGGPLLVCGPFYPRGEGRAKLRYRVTPGGQWRSLERSEVSNCLVLPDALIPLFKQKYTFHLTVILPDGEEERTLEQKFSLMGFSYAYRVLQSERCAKD